MKTSNYIYGKATGYKHGDLQDAIDAGIITLSEAKTYEYQSSMMMKGRRFKGDWDDNIQMKLDKFFKHDLIDYSDFKNLCSKISGEQYPTVCDYSSFLKGHRCYYKADGQRVDVDFKSRFL